MKKSHITPIQTENAPQAIGPYSQGVMAGGFIFFSGQIALTPEGDFIEGDIKAQTEQVLQNIEALLNAAGITKEQVVKTTIFLSSMEDFAAVNKLYEKFFGAHKPARSTIAVKTLPKNALIEIEVIAYKGEA